MEWSAPSDNRISGLVNANYAAPTRPPHLKAMCPVSGPVTYFQNCVYRRGVFELGWMLTYFTFMARNTLAREGDLPISEGLILDSYLRGVWRFRSPRSSLTRFRHLPPFPDWAERLGKGAHPYFADRYLRHWKG